MENSILNYLTIKITLFLTLYRCHFNVHSKMLYGSIGAEFLRISRATSKIEDLSLPCKQSNVKTKWTNKENQIFLDKNVPTAPRSFD